LLTGLEEAVVLKEEDVVLQAIEGSHNGRRHLHTVSTVNEFLPTNIILIEG
jgi:hypothetical protein